MSCTVNSYAYHVSNHIGQLILTGLRIFVTGSSQSPILRCVFVCVCVCLCLCLSVSVCVLTRWVGVSNYGNMLV